MSITRSGLSRLPTCYDDEQTSLIDAHLRIIDADLSGIYRSIVCNGSDEALHITYAGECFEIGCAEFIDDNNLAFECVPVVVMNEAFMRCDKNSPKGILHLVRRLTQNEQSELPTWTARYLVVPPSAIVRKTDRAFELAD